MIVISGFDELLKKYSSLPDSGWLYVDESFDLTSIDDIERKRYYIAEDEDEEMDFEENYGTFLESPIFKAIIENKLEHTPQSDRDDLFNAVIYYINNDDFMD